MKDKIESNNNYETVGDEDVLLFHEATFMVRRFKELAARQFSKIVEIYVEKGGYSPRKMRVFWVCGVNCIIYELYARG